MREANFSTESWLDYSVNMLEHLGGGTDQRKTTAEPHLVVHICNDFGEIACANKILDQTPWNSSLEGLLYIFNVICLVLGWTRGHLL